MPIWNIEKTYEIKKVGESEGLIFQSESLDPKPVQGGASNLTVKMEIADDSVNYELEIVGEVDGEEIHNSTHPIEPFDGDEGITWTESVDLEIPDNGEELKLTLTAT